MLLVRVALQQQNRLVAKVDLAFYMILMVLLISVMPVAAVEVLEQQEALEVRFQQTGMLRFISPPLQLHQPGTLLAVAVDGMVVQVVTQVILDAHLAVIYTLELRLSYGPPVPMIVTPICIPPKKTMDQSRVPEAEPDLGMVMAVMLLLTLLVELVEPAREAQEANLKLVRG